ERWVPDEDLNLRLVHPLVTRVVLGELDLERQADYDAATGEPVITSGRGEGYGAQSSSGTLGIYSTGNVAARYWYDRYDGRGGPCGVRNALQDGQDYEEPLTVTGYCDYLDGDESLVYEYEGRANMQGHKAYHFREPEHPYLQLWTAADVPFPLRFTASLADIICSCFLGHERMYDLRMEEFTPGTGSYSWPQESVIVPGAGLPALVPRVPTVVDTAGYPFPFAFKAAYDAAVSDSAYGLAAWLGEHPGAYVAEAFTQEWTDENGATHYAWAFIVTDGREWTGRFVHEGPLQLLQGLTAPALTGRSVSVRAWEPAGDERNWAGHYLPPDRLPATLPSAKDVLARHRFVENRDIPGAHYLGWQLTCKTPACLEPDVWMAAGYLASNFTYSQPPVIAPSGQAVAYSIFAVDGSGHALARNAYSLEREGFTVTGATGSGGDGSGFSIEPKPLEAQATWVLPNPAAATGLGLLGVLASILYYFWPHAKGLALAPLFSRIDEDDLLDNPNRARILDLVRAEPGIHFQDLSRKAAVGRGTLDHHLRKLVDAELVTIRRTSGYSCCFPKGVGAIDRRLMDAAPVLRSEGGRAVLQVVARRPGASSRDLAVELGLAPSTVSYHHKRLETAGLVLPDPTVGVRLTPLGEQAKA
ncbi:MAG: hypothetical protein QOC71_841, partial [Thermoplasmata archaeon]|nr:hypothetical protein [Thermoplasmata archaeon]